MCCSSSPSCDSSTKRIQLSTKRKDDHKKGPFSLTGRKPSIVSGVRKKKKKKKERSRRSERKQEEGKRKLCRMKKKAKG